MKQLFRLVLLMMVAGTAGTFPVRAEQAGAFKDAAAVWRDVEAQAKELDKLVKTGKLEEVHAVAFEIRDLVRTLPDKSKALAPDRQKKLAAHVKTVDQIAVLLDKYGDVKNRAATRAQQKRLRQVLDRIRALYPAGALKTASAAAERPVTEAERRLYLTPGGAYTEVDIRANGRQVPSQRLKGVPVQHDAKPAVGDRICPITLTKANPKLGWSVGGNKHQFCCPPCIEEFVKKAKAQPNAVHPPEDYVKR